MEVRLDVNPILYRSKKNVEAMQFTTKTALSIMKWSKGKIRYITTVCDIEKLSTTNSYNIENFANIGDYVVKRFERDFVFIKKEVFEKAYENINKT